MKRHAYIFKDSQTCHTAFMSFTAGPDFQRSDSGKWYSSHEATHKFLCVAQSDRLRGVTWDSIQIADDVDSQDKAHLIAKYMNAGFKSTKGITIAELPGTGKPGQPGKARSFPGRRGGRVGHRPGHARDFSFIRTFAKKYHIGIIKQY